MHPLLGPNCCSSNHSSVTRMRTTPNCEQMRYSVLAIIIHGFPKEQARSKLSPKHVNLPRHPPTKNESHVETFLYSTVNNNLRRIPFRSSTALYSRHKGLVVRMERISTNSSTKTAHSYNLINQSSQAATQTKKQQQQS